MAKESVTIKRLAEARLTQIEDELKALEDATLSPDSNEALCGARILQRQFLNAERGEITRLLSTRDDDDDAVVHMAMDVTQPQYGDEPITGEPRGRLFVDLYESSLRIVLDSQTVECDPHLRPDFFIEWRGDHWGIALHPHDGDPVLFVKIYESAERGGFYSIIAEDPDENREDVELWEKRS